MKKNKKRKRLMFVSRLLFLIYMFFIIYFLLISEQMGRVAVSYYRYNLTPFQEMARYYNAFNNGKSMLAITNLAGNVLIFVPFGMYVAMEADEKAAMKSIIYTFIFSLFVELVQLYYKIGIFDVDDLILNTAGGLLGFLIFWLVSTINNFDDRRRKSRRKKTTR